MYAHMHGRRMWEGGWRGGAVGGQRQPGRSNARPPLGPCLARRGPRAAGGQLLGSGRRRADRQRACARGGWAAAPRMCAAAAEEQQAAPRRAVRRPCRAHCGASALLLCFPTSHTLVSTRQVPPRSHAAPPARRVPAAPRRGRCAQGEAGKDAALRLGHAAGASEAAVAAQRPKTRRSRPQVRAPAPRVAATEVASSNGTAAAAPATVDFEELSDIIRCGPGAGAPRSGRPYTQGGV